jgi:hypothetical protein
VKITFEGKTIHDILEEMASVLAATSKNTRATTVQAVEGPGPDRVANALPANVPVDKPVENPVEKPPEKPKIDRVAAMNKARAAKVAKAEAAKNAPPPEPELFEEPKAPIDPVEVVKIRQKTIEDLQSAYANGHQKEVFELLSRFGNGAKSFRELPPDAFVPISEAISKGALT